MSKYELDRMLANNQDSTRMNQAKQIAKSTAEIALLAVGIHGKAVFNKAAGSVSSAAGTELDVAGKEAARIKIAADASRIKAAADAARIKAAADAARIKAANAIPKKPGMATPTIPKKSNGFGGKENLKPGYDNLLNLVSKNIDKEKSLHALKTGGEFAGKQVLSQIRAEVKKQLPDDAKDPMQALLKGSSTLGGIRNSLDAFKGLASVDTNRIINGASKLVLGKPDITHGVVGYASKVLKGTVSPGKKTLEAREAMVKMTELETGTNTLAEKNLKILKDSGVKDLPEKILTKKDQEALMNREVSAKILKDTDWLKNKTEFSSLRKDIADLGSKISAINRGSFDVTKETITLEKINEEQKDLVEQVKTMIEHDEKSALILDAAPEKIMDKNFLASLNLTNGKNAFDLVDDFHDKNTLKNLLANDLQAQLREGEEHLDYMIGRTTADLLGDTRKMFETAKKDSDDDDRSEADIRRMRKA